MPSLKRFSALCLFASASLLFTQAFAGSVRQGAPNPDCPQFFAFGVPQTQDAKLLRRAFHICRKAYSVYFDPMTKTPLWSAEKLVGEQQTGEETRTDDFRADPDIPRGAGPILADYASSGFDRGHMSPAGDMRQDMEAMSESFFLTNMIPQDPDNNRHAWAQLEQRARSWAKNRGVIFVFTGPVYNQGQALGQIGKGRVWVPTHIYKIAIDAQKGEAIAFILPNASVAPDGSVADAKHPPTLEDKLAKSLSRRLGHFDAGPKHSNSSSKERGSYGQWSQTLSGFIVPMSQVESLTGFDFAPLLRQDWKNKIKSDRGPFWKTR